MSNGNKRKYEGANVMNISAKFQFHPPMASEEKIFEYFVMQISPFGCYGNQSNLVVWTRFTWSVENYSRNISVKRLSKYLQ